MDMLDETVGATNWKRAHSRDNANCIVSVWDDDKKEWVSKEDTGTESFTEKEKGLASDSFKRACVNWGIGRELYTATNIFVYKPYDKKEKFRVSKIEYDSKRNIVGLEIINNKNEIVYRLNSKSILEPSSLVSGASKNNVSTNNEKTITEPQQKRLFAISKGNTEAVRCTLEKHGYEHSKDIKMSEYEQICKEIEECIKEVEASLEEIF